MSELQIRGQINLSTVVNGDGDPLLARDATSGAIGVNSTALTASLSAGQLLVGNASNVAQAMTITGDVTINSSGVTAITSGVIVNGDINASAAIALTKLAATTVSRALVSNGSGVISPATTTATEIGYVNGVTSSIQTQLNSKQATITGGATTITSADLTSNRALISSGAGKVAVSTVTNTELGYLSGVTSAVQTQLNARLSATITTPATGDIIYFNGAAWVNLPRGTNGQALYSTAGSIQWNTPTINGIPTGGTTGQSLVKLSGTDFDANWGTLSIASLPDITSTAAELNILDGATLTTSELNYVDGVTSAIQPQIDSKLASTLPQNSIYVGNGSNVATPYAAGSNGQVLQIVAGVPTWQTISGTGSVTSVAASGGTTGMSFTGSPITTSGTLTLSGTLAVANGGTGLTSLGTALQLLRVNAGATALEYATVGGISGLTTNRIPYATSATTLGDDSMFTWDATNNRLYIGDGGAGGVIITGGLANSQTVVLGNQVAAPNTTFNGTGNTGLGSAVFRDMTSGGFNTMIGRACGVGLTSGSFNTFVGSNAGDSHTTGSGNLLLGYNIDAQSGTSDNQMSIQNVIFGSGNSGANTTVSSGNLGLYATAWGTSASRVIAIGNGTAPSTSPTDSVQIWAEDLSASSKLRLRDEAGNSGYVPIVLYGSATLDFPSTSGQSNQDLTISVTGAALNDTVVLGVPHGSVGAGTCFTAWVSAADTVTVRHNNYSASPVNPASGTFKVTVIKF